MKLSQDDRMRWTLKTIVPNLKIIELRIIEDIRRNTGLIIDPKKLNMGFVGALLFFLFVFGINFYAHRQEDKAIAYANLELQNHYVYVTDTTTDTLYDYDYLYDHPTDEVYFIDKKNHDNDSYNALSDEAKTYVDENLTSVENGLYSLNEELNFEGEVIITPYKMPGLQAQNAQVQELIVNSVELMSIDNFSYMYESGFLNNETIAFVNKDIATATNLLPAITSMYTNVEHKLTVFIYDSSYNYEAINDTLSQVMMLQPIDEIYADEDVNNDVVMDDSIAVINDNGLTLAGFDEMGNVTMLKNDYVNVFIEGPGLCGDKNELIDELIADTSILLSSFYNKEVSFNYSYHSNLVPEANCDLAENNPGSDF